MGDGVCLYQVLLTCAVQDPRHLQYVADVNESNVYVVTQGRKLYGMPTDFGFCIKVKSLAWSGRQQELLSTRILPGASKLPLGPLDSSPCTLPCPTETGDRRRETGDDLWS